MTSKHTPVEAMRKERDAAQSALIEAVQLGTKYLTQRDALLIVCRETVRKLAYGDYQDECEDIIDPLNAAIALGSVGEPSGRAKTDCDYESCSNHGPPEKSKGSTPLTPDVNADLLKACRATKALLEELIDMHEVGEHTKEALDAWGVANQVIDAIAKTERK